MGAKRKDLTGQKFGRWTVLEYVGNHKYLCRCDCGTEREVASGHLTSNASKSCGCLQREVAREQQLNMSEEQRRSIGEKGRARKHTDESKAKISKANRKSDISDEEREQGRFTHEDYEWKQEVKKQANYTCDICSERGRKTTFTSFKRLSLTQRVKT